MKITPVPHGFDGIVGISPGDRSEGLHMSAIYGEMFKQIDPKRYGRGGHPDPVVLEAGLAVELIFERAIRERLVGSGRPGEFTHVDPKLATPIIYSPDLILFNGHTRLGEIKLTWMSTSEVPNTPTNSFPEKFDKYVCQMQSYCWCLETPYARLITYHVNGGYEFLKKGHDKKRGPQPKLLAWDIEFSARELKENWAAIINTAKSMGVK